MEGFLSKINRHQESKNKAKKLEGSMSEERKGAMEKQIGQVNYGKSGEIETGNDEMSINFSYDFADYSHYVRDPYEIGLLEKHYFSNDWRKLNGFRIKDTKTGKEIDLFSDLPEGYVILFNPFCNKNNGEANTRYRGCLVESDIATMHGILILLHEIGHVIDFEKSEEKGEWEKINFENVKTDKEFEFCVEKERSASAYMLNKLRPLIRSGAISKEDVLYYLHKSIATRNNNLWEKLKNKLEAILNK